MELRPIWVKEPLPRHFPQDPRLDRLLDSNYGPRSGYFKLRIKRRHARDLRKGMFGPKGIRRNVPDSDGGVRVFDLPDEWLLRLTYYPTRGGDPESGWEAGDVDAEFIPLGAQRRSIPPRRPTYPTTEAHP
jgi:hypothetical protein